MALHSTKMLREVCEILVVEGEKRESTRSLGEGVRRRELDVRLPESGWRATHLELWLIIPSGGFLGGNVGGVAGFHGGRTTSAHGVGWSVGVIRSGGGGGVCEAWVGVGVGGVKGRRGCCRRRGAGVRMRRRRVLLLDVSVEVVVVGVKVGVGVSVGRMGVGVGLGMRVGMGVGGAGEGAGGGGGGGRRRGGG